MKRLLFLAPAAVLLTATLASAADPFRIFDDKLPQDSRLTKPQDYNGYFPWTPPKTKEVWEKRRQELREQVLVSLGLWPLPEKVPLNPVVHGKIDRDEYTIEKVFFTSYPGFYVTGNLYRPKGKTGKLPGVLVPHGHWANGRFFEANDRAVEAELKSGGEKTKEGARYPLQACCASLARMGCVVFHYDMVGNADSKQIAHRAGFTDAEAELRLQNFMGLQTFNSIRALDFLLGLPEVDAKRVGVTGSSGGGTQTFLLCAIDDRPTVAVPVVMVSTAMQGGCICENCSYLRVGTGNVELAGLFAPKPMLMIGANDWTVDIETKGYPELRALYGLYGAEEKVLAKCYKQYGHNYNQASRELMYNWFNKYLDLGQKEPVEEKPFTPVAPAELSVFDEQHPLPKDATDSAGLRRYLTEASDKQMATLEPKDEGKLKEFRNVIGPALRVMIGDTLPKSEDVDVKEVGERTELDGLVYRRYLLSRKGTGEQIPAVGLMKEKNFDGTVVVWIHPEGKSSLWKDGKLVPAAQEIVDRKAAILAPDVFWTGELRGTVVKLALNPKKLELNNIREADVTRVMSRAVPPGVALGQSCYLFPAGDAKKTIEKVGSILLKDDDGDFVHVSDAGEVTVRDVYPVNEAFAGYTYGYNRPLLANRVHDILTTVAFARGHKSTKQVHLIGWDTAGRWVVPARSLCGDAVARTAADCGKFTFDAVKTTDDPMMLPGALKYEGLPAIAALSAPHELYLINVDPRGVEQWLKAAYKSAGKPEQLHIAEKPEKVVEWMLR